MNLLDQHGAPLKVMVPGPKDDAEYLANLAKWAELMREVPRMDRHRIYEAFGKAKPKTVRVWQANCDDPDCETPPVRCRIIKTKTPGVLPHGDIRVLRRRAERECLRRMPSPPYRYAGVELRRPGTQVYMDGL